MSTIAETLQEIEIVEYDPKFGYELVRMWRDSFERAVGVIDSHPLEKQLRYLEKKVIAENEVRVVLEKRSSEVIAFMASTQDRIAQLYVHADYQKRGIGTMLLDIAKRNSSGRLSLFTFKVNENAQRFYERNGFEVRRFGFEEEWQLEDVEYEWSGPRFES